MLFYSRKLCDLISLKSVLVYFFKSFPNRINEKIKKLPRITIPSKVFVFPENTVGVPMHKLFSRS